MVNTCNKLILCLGTLRRARGYEESHYAVNSIFLFGRARGASEIVMPVSGILKYFILLYLNVYRLSALNKYKSANFINDGL